MTIVPASDPALNDVAEQLYDLRRSCQTLEDRIAASAEKFDNLVRAAAVAAVFVDADLAISDFTPNAARLFDLNDADIGRTVSGLGCRIAFDQFNDSIRQVITSRTPFERDVLQIDGGWLAMRVHPCESADPRARGGAIIIFRDIQSLKIAQAGLEKRSTDLQSFAYAVSHDLQEPARMIISFSELIERRYGNGQDETQQSYLEQIRSGGRRLRDMLDSLLRYSRVDTRGAPMTDFPLDRALAAARETLSDRIAREDASFEVAPLPSVWGDEAQLRWVLRELIENALKFRSDRRPHLRIQAGRRSDGLWRIAVSDNGIGIGGGQAENAFRIFKRLRDHAAGHGVGAGLAVVARIVERHGGEIQAESAEDGGTTLWFTLHGHAPAPSAARALNAG
ncbi:His Kinase A (phospho-acceptor) domain-containing protein [Sphingomonas sp. YR710]|uniref:sensor histidine kinase n=1 Tax=Sphingomonas sp. YR710 TaxID=1882773 RepID=UPI000886EF4B|nr:ATP-binding protein [Sphingomonas sp. YR710]SDC29385.1 His Kinase A (phospho-acceptor) domain-containing protein [Sphingomonas sp. YR710]